MARASRKRGRREGISKKEKGSSGGWTTVDVGGEFLDGMEEGGFAGLEVLEAGTLMYGDCLRDGTEEEATEEEQGVGEVSQSKESAIPSKKGGEEGKVEEGKVLSGQARRREEFREARRLARQEARREKAAAKLQKQNNSALEAKEKKSRVEGTEVGLAGVEDENEAYLLKELEEEEARERLFASDAARARGEDECVDALALPDESPWKRFQLDERLEKAICGLGFTSPTPIQEKTFAETICSTAVRDLVGAAQTGSGKTLAFGIPVLDGLLKEKKQINKKLRCLMLTPTRELAIQVADMVEAVAKATNLRVVKIVGGISVEKQKRTLSKLPEIVVGTPGRLWDLLRASNNHLSDMSQLKYLVIDEADRMLAKGQFEELGKILDLIRCGSDGRNSADVSNEVDDSGEHIFPESARSYKAPKQLPQALVFSATIAVPPSIKKSLRRKSFQKGETGMRDPLGELLRRLRFRRNPAIVDVSSPDIVASKVKETSIRCAESDREAQLYYMLGLHDGRALVFCNSISTVKRLATLLDMLQVPVVALHANMQQRARLKALDRFKAWGNGEGKGTRVMIATDVAARGLDIAAVRMVVHFHLPPTGEIYVHRCGRTARAAEDGLSVALITPGETNRYMSLCRALQREELLDEFPVELRVLKSCSKRMNIAMKLERVHHEKSRDKKNLSWMVRQAEEAGILLDDEDLFAKKKGKSRKRVRDEDTDEDDNDEHSREYHKLKSTLKTLLAEPLIGPGVSRKFPTKSMSNDGVLRQRLEAASRLIKVKNSRKEEAHGTGGDDARTQQLIFGGGTLPSDALKVMTG